MARRLAQDGVLVAVNDVNEAAAETVARETKGVAFVFDVTDSTAFSEAVDEFTARTGRLDIMINNAGIAPREPGAKIERMIRNQTVRATGDLSLFEAMDYLVDMDDREWDRMIRIHLYGAFYGCRAALKHMQTRRSGKIINVSSILGLKPAAGAPHYSAAKAGIIALTRSVAAEAAPLGINVNAVCPGYIDTPLLDPFGDLLKSAIVNRIGKGRLGSPSDVAEVVRFLSGPESDYCVGEVFSISGGYD